MRRYCILALVALVAAATPALAIPCSETASILGAGPSQGVVAIDDLAVIGAGPGIVVFDMTDPSDPIQLGKSELGETATPVGSIDGRVLVFVAEQSSYRLAVIDPNPEGTPEEVSSIALPDRLRPDDLVVGGDTAWIVTSSRDQGLIEVDLDDLSRPLLTTVLELPTAATSMTAVDNHLFIITRDGLLVADVSDEAAPEIIGSLEIEGARSITSTGGYAYVSTDFALHTIEIVRPATPFEVSTVEIDRVAAPLSMILTDEHLIIGLVDFDPHIAPPDGGLLTFDISEPSYPAAISDTHFSSGPMAMAVSRGAVIAADSERGLRVFDPDPSNGHEEIARRNITMDDAFSVAVHQDTAYLGDQGLRIIDISDHAAPELLGSIELDGEIIDVAVNETGNRIAALARGADLYLFSATDPESPVLETYEPISGWRLAISGNLLAIVAGNNGLSLIDISDPAQPAYLSLVQTGGQAYSVAMEDEIVVVGMSTSGAFGAMAIYDVSDPVNPVLLSQTPTLSGVYGVDIEGSRVAIATWDTAVLFDISDSSAPLELGRYDNDHWTADGIALTGDRVHLSAWPGGLQILDFSSTFTPRRVVRTWWFPFPIMDGGPLGGYDVAVHQGGSIVADGRFGLRILDVKMCLPELGPSPPPATVD